MQLITALLPMCLPAYFLAGLSQEHEEVVGTTYPAAGLIETHDSPYTHPLTQPITPGKEKFHGGP